MSARSFDAIAVLTRSGRERDAFCAAVTVDGGRIDAQLVADVLRVSGRVSSTLGTRRALVELCALVRALQSFVDGSITASELASGMAVHAGRTERFAAFDEARVLLRTVEEVLDGGRRSGRAVVEQIRLLHASLHEWLVDELVGAGGEGSQAGPAVGGMASPASGRTNGSEASSTALVSVVADPVARRRAHDLAQDLLHGADGYPLPGLAGAAWRRGWTAVPIAGDALDEQDARGPERFVAALASLPEPPDRILRITRRRSPAWRLDADRRLHPGDGLRDAAAAPCTPAGLTALLDDAHRGWCIFTTDDLALACVEGAGHHVVLGPSAAIDIACGGTALDAVARFREHVESLAVDGEGPPPDLLEIATTLGRVRRRAPSPPRP